MSTITKEWLQKAIRQHESIRDEIPFDLDEDDNNTLAALRIALASLESKAVGYIDAEYSKLIKSGHIESCSVYAEPGEGCITVFTAPSAPASVPDEIESTSGSDYDDYYCDGWNACRAAMLQSADGNSPVIPDGWQLVPKQITLEMECALSRADSYEIGWRWALAAAPQQDA